MKKCIHLTLLSILLIFVGRSAYSQVRWGIKAGINLTKGEFESTTSKTDWALRGSIGLLSEIEVSKKLYLRPELLYSQKGWMLNEASQGQPGKGSMTLHYLTLPVLLAYRPSGRWSIMAGPEVGYLLTAARRPKITYDYNKIYKKVDVGLALGAAYSITPRLGLELRYIHSIKALATIEKTNSNGVLIGNESDGYNRAFQFGLFYRFGKSKE
jgi:outer membrane immunogenic protein